MNTNVVEIIVLIVSDKENQFLLSKCERNFENFTFFMVREKSVQQNIVFWEFIKIC